MEIVDEILGTLANILEVSAALSAAIVFFTSREKAEKISKSILATAEWSIKSGWLAWLKRASTIAYRKFERLYGPRATPTKFNFHGYLTDRSLKVSFRLTNIYLLFGTPLLIFVAIAWLQLSEQHPRYFDIALCGLVILSVAIATYVEFRKANKNFVSDDKLQDFIKASFFGGLLPTMTFFFTVPFVDVIKSDYVRFPVVLMALLLLLFFFYKAIREICGLFGMFTPLGLILYIFVSFPSFLLAVLFAILADYFIDLSFVEKTLAGEILEPTIAFFLFLICSCIFYLLRKTQPYYRYAFFFTLIAMVFASIYAVYQSDPKQFFPSGKDRISNFSASIVLVTFVSILTSIVYANAICDWLSVAATRYLTLATANTRKSSSYATLILLDSFFAAAFFVMTLLIFTAMASLYLSLSRIPVGSFISDLKATITVTEELIVNKSRSSIGELSGNFVRIFALTAILPTLFHMAVIMAFALIKAIGRLIYRPARAILQRQEEAHSGGEHATITLHRIIYGGMIFFSISAILITGYCLTSLFGL